MDKPKTKTVIVTVTRKYIAQEKMFFEVEVPNFPMSNTTIESICRDYMQSSDAESQNWEHDDNFASHSQGGTHFHIEEKVAEAD